MSASAILLPSKINSHYWIHCVDSKIGKKYPHIDGKYVMFFPKDEIDERWKDVNILYKTGKLIGINSMKVSTQKKNHEGINKYKNGVIIFYCGPSEDKRNVLEYGRNLLKNIYYNDSILYYKSEKPHLRDSTRRYSNLYTIDVDVYYKRPRNDSDRLSVNQSTVYNFKFNAQPRHQQVYRQNYFDHNSSSPQKNNFTKIVGDQIPNLNSNGRETFSNSYHNWSLSSPQTQFNKDVSYNAYESSRLGNHYFNYTPQFNLFNYPSFYQPFVYQSPFYPNQNNFYPIFGY